MKTLKASIAFTLFFLICTNIFAQDSTATGPEAVNSIFGIAIPDLIKTVIVALLIVLPSIQLVLKRIPTNGSVKIQGLLGKVLDFLTFFQKDKINK